MAEYISEASIKVTLDLSQLEDGVKEANEAIGGIGKTTSSTNSGVTSLSSGFADLTLGIHNLKEAFSGLKSTTSTIGDLVNSNNRYQASLNGVVSVARATGNDVAESMQVIKDSTANGLLTQSDAAAAVKNLELYGYTAQQAGQMIKVMTDAAVYNRQANYSVSEAVRVTTEGIRMENSVLSDAAGIQKNIAKMHEDYAKALGKSTENLTDAEKAQAVYNGVLGEGNTFLGDAEGYSDSLAGAQNKMANAVETAKANIGALFEKVAPVVNGLADWMNENQELVAGIATFLGVLVGAGGLIGALALAFKALQTVKSAIMVFGLTSKAAKGGVIGLAVGIASIATAAGVAAALNTATDAEWDLGNAASRANNDIDEQGDITSETAKKLAKLNQQLEKLTRDYRRDLKQIAVDHEENLNSLTRQVEEANVDYVRAIDERMAEFDVTMAKQERSHQETVYELMTQLAFLQRYNNDYNKEKLAQVQFALAKEQQLYQRETAALQAEVELQNTIDKEKLDKKLASLQEELDEEVAFMNKHRDILNSVRDVILLDEVESLRERYEEQKKSYAEQLEEAKVSGTNIGDAFNNGMNDSLKKDYSDIGQDIGKSIVDGLGKGVQQAANSFGQWIGQGGPAASIWKWLLGEEKFNQMTGRSSGRSSGGGGWATGGYTGRGPADEVAGVVHRGEFVLPADMVDQNSGLPKAQAQNITINLSGVLATSAQAKRDLAIELSNAISQVNQSRIGA